MPSKSKQKEGRHLSQIIPVLDAWWGEPFKRVPASGALRWDTGHWIWGDIVPPTSLPLVIEAKSHKEVDVDEVIRKPWDQCKITWFWYNQTIGYSLSASETLKRQIFPCLIYKENQNVSRIVLQEDLFRLIPKEVTDQFPRLVCYVPGASPFVISDLETFCRKVSRDIFSAIFGGSDVH